MVWDFAEANPLSSSTGNFMGAIDWIVEVGEAAAPAADGIVHQQNATVSINGVSSPLISTDPPYYDNIGYADLADFFYVWLRRSLGGIYPDILGTLLAPKSKELVATPYRFGGDKRRAQEFFEEGLGEAFARMREAASPDHPLTIYYAFKQAEANAEGDGTMVVASTGWESMLEGLISTGFQITGTWPMRTERSARSVGIGTNALASSIVLVCRPRPEDAPPATRREFQNALRRELPGDLRVMMGENIAPVDLAQATIGPGMAIYSRYSEVLEADGSPLPVRAALQMINGVLDEILAEQEGELDDDSRFCLAWFTQRAHDTGPFGEADVLARARNTSVAGLERAGVVSSRGGDVRLLRRDELPEGWDPSADERLPAWESTQHLVRAVMRSEREAAALVKALGPERAESSRALSYRLYQLCERKSRAEDALAYNTLVQSWPRLQQLAAEQPEISLFEQ